MKFNYVSDSNGGLSRNLTAFVDGEMYVADESHPNIDALVTAAIAGNEDEFLNLIDPSVKAAEKFSALLTDRVTVRNSRVYVDQIEVEGAFADQIVRFLEEDVDDWEPLALFLEKVYSNVDADIRENLSRWLQAEAFTLLPNGNILGYRGLRSDYTSVHAGPGIVNGVEVNGHLDNSVGNVVEIDAKLVEVNASRGCASGLHVGTYEYAKSWSQGQLVSVEVDPRHVRSVPYECGSSKMRVSKYKVLADVTTKDDSTVSLDFEVADEFDVASEDYIDGYIDGYEDAADGAEPKF